MTSPAYLIITPARNEERFFRRTCESVARQTIPPKLWIVIDDGSTDSTKAIAEEYAEKCEYMRVMSATRSKSLESSGRLNRGLDAVAFNEALATTDLGDYDYVGKLDADVEFEPDYYERLFAEFDKDDRLGICSGHVYEHNPVTDRMEMAWVPEWHARGAGKVYRRACFEAIGGIEEILGWDGIDEAKAQIKGWYSRVFVEPRLIHLRPQGGRDGILRGRVNLGLHSYILHYHPLFILPRALRLGSGSPIVLGGLAYIYGYLRACLTRPERYSDKEVIRFIRRSQLSRMVGGRPYAMSGEELARRERA